jgi:AcrR family transcriptional regulator
MAQSRRNRHGSGGGSGGQRGRGTVPARRAAETEASLTEARPDRRRLKGNVSRERILEAAIELFSERGYAGSGVHEIARRAGIEKAALYWHFGSKEGLLAAVLDRTDAEFVERIYKKVALSASSDERLDLFVGGLKRLAAERGHMVRLMLSIAIERSKVSAESRAAVKAVFERTRAAVVQGFEQALGVKLPDIDLIARLALAFLDEAAVRSAIDPEGAEHDRFFAHLRRLIVLDVEDQIRRSGTRVDPARLPTRK